MLFIHRIDAIACSAEIVMKKADITSREPVAIDVKKGEDYWCCTCGKSKTQPFCDGSHDGTGCKPFHYRASSDTTEWFCSCKDTCDQSCPMINTVNPDITNQI